MKSVSFLTLTFIVQRFLERKWFFIPLHQKLLNVSRCYIIVELCVSEEFSVCNLSNERHRRYYSYLGTVDGKENILAVSSRRRRT